MVTLFVSLKGKKLKMYYGFAETSGLLPESLLLRDTTGQVYKVKVIKEPRAGKLDLNLNV